jgi:Antitoxin of toxin-antitoxin stability system
LLIVRSKYAASAKNKSKLVAAAQQFCALDSTCAFLYALGVKVVNITEARSKLYALVDQAAQEHKPIMIKGKRNNALLISEEDWAAINETLYLCSIPGMRESMIEGGQEPIGDCSRENPL